MGEQKVEHIVFEKKSVVEVIVLAIITLGIYVPVWFLNRIERFNELESEHKFTINPFGFAIASLVAYIGIVCYVIFSGLNPESGEGLKYIGIGEYIVFVASLVMMFECLKARRAFLDHFAKKNYEVSFSWFWTAMFGMIYLQYRINEFSPEEEKLL
ncbi:MAG: DUF4234 domain-containing protein [Deltaproteobacteria bacterium]|nr:DUF4234 domain-containing protein [Deltaproteobacteria bacterium]